MIFTDRTIIVKKGASSINDTIILYRGDKGVEIRFTLNEDSPFKFGSGASPNIIEKTEAAYGQLVIKTPGDKAPIFSEIIATKKGAITFTITAEMIDEITEVGNYTFQIRLLDENKEGRVTIPEVVNGIEIREPIATEDVTTTNEVGVATVGYALTTVGATEDAFDTQGNYNKTTWGTGDRITAAKLNKIEAGIDGVNQKVASGGTGGEVDLSSYAKKADLPTKTSQLTNDSGYITNVPDEYITETELNAKGYATTSQIPTVPTNISEFTNDANYASETFVTNKIAEAQLGGGVNTNGYKVYNVLDYNISTSNEDNTPALQSLINLVSDNGGGTIFFPVGTYNFKKASTQASGTYSSGHVYAILAKSNVSIIGENIENTILKCVEATPYSLFYRYIGSTSDTIHGCTYSNFTVDCYDTGSTNKVFGKVFFYQYVKDCVFRDLILKGTIATAMGIDFLDNVEINNVTCIDCGRTFINETSTTGTSGIGIGTGGFENENFKVTNCVCVGCGQYGIFIENQHTLNWGGNTDNPKGCIISNCITRNGLYRGIGVRGGTNVIVSNCNSYENAQDGIYLDNKCVNVKISNNSVIGNRSNGILIKSNSNSEDIDINDNFIKGNTNYGILLSTNTNGLMLRHNVTKGNTNGGLHSDNGLTHSNTIAKNNIFVDSEDTTNDIFTEITTYNDLLKESNATITSIICDDFTVKLDTTKTVIYSVVPSYADKSKVTISTTDTNYITVDNNAKTVTGIAVGTGTLTLEADGVIKTVTFTVVEGNTLALGTSDFAKGIKIMPDGSESTDPSTFTTTYIDVSKYVTHGYKNVHIQRTGMNGGIRLGQYDSSKTTLSNSFPIVNFATDSNVVDIELLSSVKYVRLMLTGAASSPLSISATFTFS